MSSEPKPVGRAVCREGDTLWLDCKHTIRKGDVLAAAPTPGRLRIGRLVVSAVEYSGRLRLAEPGAIASLVADPVYGDWIYLVDEPSVESRIDGLARQIAAIGGTPDALPIVQSFTLAGRWRVYFNRHGAADRPWCVAPEAGGWELAVSSVSIVTAAETVYQPKPTPDDEDGRPSAWIAVDGQLTVFLAGHATIAAARPPEVAYP